MASKKGVLNVIMTGDAQLTKALNSLQRNLGRKLHRTAARKAAKIVLAKAKTLVPRKTGNYARSLTVRAIKRSRKYQGYNVTQRVDYATKKNKSGTVTADKNTGYYGVYQELGWVATGRKARSMGDETVTTYRGTTFGLSQVKKARKIPGQWKIREAGTTSEPEVIRTYHEELSTLLMNELK